MIDSIRSIIRTRMLLVLLALSLLAAITGCAKGEAELRVKANGTAKLNLTFTLDSTMLQAISGDWIWGTISDELTQRGFEVDPVKSIHGSKALRASLDLDLKNAAPVQISGVDVTHTTDSSSWWYTTEAVNVMVDMTELVPEQASRKLRSLSPLVRELALRQIGFDFKLTMPIRAASNNADVITNGGKSLTWHLSATRVNDIQVEVHVPNIKHLAIVGGAVLILLVAAMIVYTRRRRKKKRLE
jgi:hypothetical protein